MLKLHNSTHSLTTVTHMQMSDEDGLAKVYLVPRINIFFICYAIVLAQRDSGDVGERGIRSIRIAAKLVKVSTSSSR